jgi:hypothetical protein
METIGLPDRDNLPVYAGLAAFILCLLFAGPVMASVSIDIVVGSESFLMKVENPKGSRVYSSHPADIGYLFNEVRINGETIADKEGIHIEGGPVGLDRINSVRIEKDGLNTRRERLGAGWGYLGPKEYDVEYRQGGNDRLLFLGDLIVEEGVVVEGDAVAVFGDVEVYGTVRGDVVSIYGDVFIDSTGIVGGDIISFAGDIITNPGPDIFRPLTAGMIYDKIRKTEFEIGDDNVVGFSPDIGYNRVTGVDLGADLVFRDIRNDLPTIDIEVGYTFAAKKWWYSFGIEKQFFDSSKLITGCSFYRLFDSSDQWIIGRGENNLAAFFLKEDFQDYYLREGYTLFAEQWLGYAGRVRLTYLADSYDFVMKNTDWALFGRGKSFRENYFYANPVERSSLKGDMRSIKASVEFDNVSRYPVQTGQVSGWFGRIEYERAGHGIGGDFDFDRWMVILQRLQPLDSKQHINCRLMYGASDGRLPLQRQFTLGGISSLRGYDFKQFYGDRMVLLNAEYIVAFFEEFSAIFFFDCGKAAFGQSEFDDREFYSDIGLAFAAGRYLRINIARPVNDTDADIRITARISLPF